MNALLVAVRLLADPLRGKQHQEPPPAEKSLSAEVKDVTACP